MISYEQLCEALTRFNARRRGGASAHDLAQDVAYAGGEGRGSGPIDTRRTVANNDVFDTPGADEVSPEDDVYAVVEEENY